MKRLVCAVTVVVGIAVVAAEVPSVPPSVQEPKWKSTRPINDLPNPYKRDANWAQLPTGLKWGAVIGAEPGPDGNIYVCTVASRIRAPAARSRPSSSSIAPARC
jgi:hypothetical protein